MTDTPSRMFALLCVLVGVWIAAYWLYEPSSPRITLDDRPPSEVEPASLDRSGPPPGATAVADRPRPLPVKPPAAPAPVQAARTAEPASPSVPNAPQPRTPDATPPAPANPAPPQPAESTRKIVIEPRFTDYIVERGDTGFQGIAKKFYNDASRWQSIAKANPYVPPDRLKPGVTKLRIPVDPDNIQGRVVEVPVEPTPRTSAGDAANPARPPVPKPAPPPAPPSDGVTYTVRAGDTLWGIAAEVYGRGAQWRRIYDANRAVMDDPDDLPKAGTVLKIPPPSAGNATDG